jgi:hypothetical protein
LGPGQTEDAAELLRRADIALYRAKQGGRARYRCYTNGMDATERLARELELELRRAIANDELQAHFQPIVDLSTWQIEGFEALLRWPHTLRGIPPNYGKSAAKSIDAALETWRNLAAADGCLVPKIPQDSGFYRANWGRMMAKWSPNGLRPGIGPILMVIWRAGSCRPRLGNMRSGIPSLPGLA